MLNYKWCDLLTKSSKYEAHYKGWTHGIYFLAACALLAATCKPNTINEVMNVVILHCEYCKFLANLAPKYA